MITKYARMLSSKENPVGPTSMAQLGNKCTFGNATRSTCDKPANDKKYARIPCSKENPVGSTSMAQSGSSHGEDHCLW